MTRSFGPARSRRRWTTSLGLAARGRGYGRGSVEGGPPLRPVRLAYTKHPDRPHWLHETVRVGEDEHGTWLGMDVGWRFRRGDEPWLENPVAAVLCVPHDGWWCLIHNGAEHRFTDYVDICTPPRWVGDEVTMTDLDLDVVRYAADGRVEIVDRDEFDEHRVALGYPDRWVREADAAAHQVAEALRQARPPFGDVAAAWRERFLARLAG